MNKHQERAERSSIPVDEHLRKQLVAGLPVRERGLRLADVPTAVLEGGNGPPVVLLHSSGEFASLWMRVIPDLVMTHRVIVPDLPGHGASGLTDGPLDADRATAWLGELIARTCTSSPTLVGHGLGGAMAIRFAINRGNEVEQLVLVDTFGLAAFEPEPSFALALNQFIELPTEHSRDELFAQCFVDLNGLREQMGDRWRPIQEYALNRARTPSMKSALGDLMHQVGVPAIPSDDLARIMVPTALIWGRHDLQVPLGIAEVASVRYGWPLQVIENAGDDPAMEQPAAFMAALHPSLRTVIDKGPVL